MVPTELLVTAMVGGFAVAVTAVVAMATVLSHRIGDLQSQVTSRFDGVDRRFESIDRRFESIEGRLTTMQDEMVTIRASLGAIDARLTTLEQR
ncbi:MAG: hypothetical protein ACOYXW_02830 [Actinomycetota bacterium]